MSRMPSAISASSSSICSAPSAAGYVFVLSDPAAQTPLIGASGAVAGVVAAYLMLHPRQRIWILVLCASRSGSPAFWVLGFWVVFQVYSILVAQPGDQVAWWAHIGGLATGAVLCSSCAAAACRCSTAAA